MKNDPGKKTGMENKDRIIKAFEYAVDPVAVLDSGKKFMFCNRAWKSYHGLDPDADLVGQGFDPIMNEGNRQLFAEGEKAMARDGRYEKEFYAPWCDRWVKIFVFRICEIDPPVTVVVIRDISEIIRTSEEKIRARFMGVPVPIYVWKRTGDDMILADFNEAALKITEGRILKFVGRPAGEIYTGNPRIHAELLRCHDEHVTIEREMEYPSYYGDRTWWFAVKYTFAEPDLVLVHTEDISERVRAQKELEKYRDTLEEQVKERTAQLEETNSELKHQMFERQRTEEALRASEERYRSVTELASDYTYAGTIYPDGTMKRNWVAGAFEKITGYRQDEIESELGHPDMVHPDDRGIAMKHIEAYLSGRSMESEFRIFRKNGESRWICSFGMPGERSDDGGFRIVGAVKDITQRKLAELALEKRNRELRMLNGLNRIMQSSDDSGQVIRMAFEILLEESGIDTAAVWVPARDGEVFELIASNGIPGEFLDTIRILPADDEYAAKVIRGERVVASEAEMRVVDPVRSGIAGKLGIVRTVTIPIRSGGTTKAVFSLGIDGKKGRSGEETDFLDLMATHLGLGLERLDLLKARKEYEKKVKMLARTLIQSSEEEKSQIARNLHDDIGQSIIVLRSELSMFEKSLGPEDSEKIEWCSKIKEKLHELAEKTRQVALALHPAMLEDLGLIPTLQWYIDTVVKQSGIEVDLMTAGFDERIASRQSVALYRVAQEALTNVIKHSGAGKVELKLIKGFPNIIMDIKDKGRGFLMSGDGAAGGGLGITGMRERVQNIKGTFVIKSSPGKGTRIRITLPLEADNES